MQPAQQGLCNHEVRAVVVTWLGGSGKVWGTWVECVRFECQTQRITCSAETKRDSIPNQTVYVQPCGPEILESQAPDRKHPSTTGMASPAIQRQQLQTVQGRHLQSRTQASSSLLVSFLLISTRVHLHYDYGTRSPKV